MTGTCGTTEIEQVNANPPGGQPNVNGFDVDHPIEVCLEVPTLVWEFPAADNSGPCLSPLLASIPSRAFTVDSERDPTVEATHADACDTIRRYRTLLEL